MQTQDERVENSMPGKLTAFELDHLLTHKGEKLTFIDVREKNELTIAAFPFEVIHLPLSESSLWQENLYKSIPRDRKIVVLCHSGIRSLNFGIWLLQQFPDLDVWNLVGGIDAWSVDIDASIPRY